MNWDDTPAPRKPLPEDVPPPTRAFLSQFNRSFTPPALINDPYAVDRKLVISPLLVGPRSLFIPRNPYAVDPAIERMRHYLGPEELTNPEMIPSPKLDPGHEDEWFSEDDSFDIDSHDTVHPSILSIWLQVNDNGQSLGITNGLESENDFASAKDLVNDAPPIPEKLPPIPEKLPIIPEKLPLNEEPPVTKDLDKQSHESIPADRREIDLREDTTDAIQNKIDDAVSDTTLHPSPSSPSMKWRLQISDSDTASDTDSDTDSKDAARAREKPISHPIRFMPVGLAYRSNGNTTASWDEWDEPPGMLSHIEPIMGTGKRVTIELGSLIWSEGF
jgi:hypothetical protein